MSEKIEVTVNVADFLTIGLNGLIDYENNENMWFERVFQFYTMLISKSAPDEEPDLKLEMRKSKLHDGMELVQFYIFIKDTRVEPYAGNKVESYTLYANQCSLKGRQKLSCDEFIDLIRRNDFMTKKKPLIEKTMQLRFEQITVHGGIKVSNWEQKQEE
jgi:hypothetical protein